MFGSNRLFTALNIPAVTGLLDVFGTGHAIFPSTRIPESFTGTEVLNYYRTGSNQSGIGYNEYIYNVNCRSELEIDSITLMQTVISELNRTPVIDGFMYCQALQTIPPLDETDLYNTPVTVTIKSK